MQVVGILAEYNPLHQGHLRQIRWIKDKFPPRTKIVVALASYFGQRGTPALQSLRTRSLAALSAGADLVLLFPQYFSAMSGEGYARAGVQLLAATGVVNTLAASAEIFDKDLLSTAAATIGPESDRLKTRIQSHVAAGLSPHAARRQALLEEGLETEVVACFDQPNSRLAVEYLAAIRQREAPPSLKFFLCPYEPGPGYHASTIRSLILCEDKRDEPLLTVDLIDRLSQLMPTYSLALLLECLQQGAWADHARFLTYTQLLLSRATAAADLVRFRYMQGGLAERLWRLRETSQDIVRDATSRNFTRGRIQRALLSLALAIDEEQVDQAGETPAFLLPLAFNREGRYLLRKMRERASLPVFGNFSSLRQAGDPQIQVQAAMERRACRLWNVCAGQPASRVDILEPPIYKNF